VLLTRRVVQIGSKSCLEACLQAGFNGNLNKRRASKSTQKLFLIFFYNYRISTILYIFNLKIPEKMPISVKKMPL